MTVIIFWHYYRLIHINTQLLTTYCFLCYIAYFKPFKLSRSNLQEILNEVTALLATYILFVYTNWVSDLETRYQVGWVSIAMLVANVAINLSFMVVITASQTYTKLKMHWLRYRAKLKLEKK